MVDGQIALEGAKHFPNLWTSLMVWGGPGPLCWGLPGCLCDLSDLDKVQVGLMAVISILSLTKAQVVSGTA